jgi:hypothetical protein
MTGWLRDVILLLTGAGVTVAVGGFFIVATMVRTVHVTRECRTFFQGLHRREGSGANRFTFSLTAEKNTLPCSLIGRYL